MTHSHMYHDSFTHVPRLACKQGDENKHVFGEAGFTEELLNLVESPDIEGRDSVAVIFQ